MTLISLRVVPHRPFIRLTYRPCFSLDQTMACFSAQTLRDTDNDSVEGIAFTRDTSVIMTGQFVTEAEVDWARVNSMGRWYKPWFYQHVRSYLARGEGEYTECVHINIYKYLLIYVPTYLDMCRPSTSTSGTTSPASGCLTSGCPGLMAPWPDF